MLIALVCGLIAGFGCIIFREHLNSSGQGELWKTINNILFQDITAEGATSAIGIFYINRSVICKCITINYCTNGICFYYTCDLYNYRYKEIRKNIF